MGLFTRALGALGLVLLAALVLIWQWAAEHPIAAAVSAVAVVAYVWYAIHLDRVKRRELMTDSHVPSMSPTDYERFVARLLERAGWSVRHTGRTGDQGCDVLAELRGFRAVVQVKKARAGNAAVQEVVAARHHYGAQVMVVVALGFTPAARELAASNGVHLLHHSQLSSLQQKARIP